jgi:hypothetical protein
MSTGGILVNTAMEAPEIHHDLDAEQRVASRQARLARGIAALRVRSGSRLALDRVLLIAGSVLLPLGALLILLGWFGAAHTSNLYEQVPYAISGGLLGVALVATGGFFYSGYWLTRQIYDARRHNEQLLATLGRIEARLADHPLGRIDDGRLDDGRLEDGRLDDGRALAAPARATSASRAAESPTGPVPVIANSPPEVRNGRVRPLRARPSRAPAGAAAGAAGGAPVLLATATGTMLHRPDCVVVANKGDLRRVAADTSGYKPCRICDPLGSN